MSHHLMQNSLDSILHTLGVGKHKVHPAALIPTLGGTLAPVGRRRQVRHYLHRGIKFGRKSAHGCGYLRVGSFGFGIGIGGAVANVGV